MSESKGTFTAHVLIVAFSSAVVAIASHQIYVRYAPKRIARSPATRQQLLNEFEGDLDVAKASVSTTYLERYARKPNENEQKQQEQAKAEGGAGSGSDSNSSKVDTQGLKNLLNKLAP